MYTPDGKEITSVLKGGNFAVGNTVTVANDRIVNISLATGEATEILNATVYSTQQLSSPVWSPDGKNLAYVIINQTKNDSLMVYNAVNGESKLIVEINGSFSRPSFFPDGQNLVYATNTLLYRIPLAGGTPEQITVQDRHGIPYNCQNPLVHPDGKHIIFKDVDAQNLKMVNSITGAVVTISPSTGGTVNNPSLSPDGTKICYEYRTPNELHIITLDSSLFNDGNIITAVESVSPKAFPTLANYPNPFNPSTTVSFTLPDNGFTELSIYNVAGQRIRTLVSGSMTAGTHDVVWNGRDDRGMLVSTGIYISRLRIGDAVVINRMMLVK